MPAASSAARTAGTARRHGRPGAQRAPVDDRLAQPGDRRSARRPPAGRPSASCSSRRMASPCSSAFELVGRAARDDPAAVDDRELAGELVGLLEVVGREQDRQPVLAASRRISAHSSARASGSRPVVGSSRNRTRRAVDEAHGHVELALHAAGVGLGDAVGGLGQAEARRAAHRRGCAALRRRCRTSALQDEVLAARGLGIDGRPLADHADRAADRFRVADDVDASDLGGAAVRPGERGQDLDRGRLARAVRPEQAEDGAGLDGEASGRRARRPRRVALDEPVGLDRRRRARLPLCILSPKSFSY